MTGIGAGSDHQRCDGLGNAVAENRFPLVGAMR